jgi:hypothetical protein
MANKKVSQLPTFTGDTTGAFLVMDNSALTQTFKVTKEIFTGTLITEPTRGSWTVNTGANTVSLTLTPSQSYFISVFANIPNGILSYIAQAAISNTNVPVVGVQYAWYFTGGGSPIFFTSLPNQFIGTAGTIVANSSAPSSTTNIFDFGITNNSGSSQVVNYAWLKIS